MFPELLRRAGRLRNDARSRLHFSKRSLPYFMEIKFHHTCTLLTQRPSKTTGCRLDPTGIDLPLFLDASAWRLGATSRRHSIPPFPLALPITDCFRSPSSLYLDPKKIQAPIVSQLINQCYNRTCN